MAKSSARVAVIGSGYWGRNLVRNFHALKALAAVCEVDASRRLELQKLYPGVAVTGSYEEALAGADAVAIATPAESHARLARRALEAGKDVFVEKPLALSEAEGAALATLADKNSRVLMVGHLLWYHPAVLKLKELVDSGKLGKLQYIYSNRLNIGKIRREENILWSFAPHDASVILGLLGELPDKVTAQGGTYLSPGVPDATVALLSFPSGVKAHIFVSWLHPFKEQKLVVVGDQKMAVFNDLEEKDKLVLYSHKISWKGREPVVHKARAQRIKISAGEPLRAEIEHFLARIKDRKTPRTDAREGLRVLSVLNQCQKALGPSARESAGGRKFFAHESAFIDDGAEVGDGTTIWHVSHILKGSRLGKNCRIGQNVVIGPNVSVGDGCKIQNNVSVYEGVSLEDHVFCGPSMVFTNVVNPRSEIPRMQELKKTLVRQGATLGANCTVVCGTTVGRYSFVGAGAVVTKDVPDFALVTGVPARVTGWVCSCGLKLSVNGSGAKCSCGKRYEKSVDGRLLARG